MKIVVNHHYGGFSLPSGFVKQQGLEDCLDYDSDTRESEELIQYLETHGPEDSCLAIVEIPSCATDWEIHDYDGFESILCVIDGKIRWLHQPFNFLKVF